MLQGAEGIEDGAASMEGAAAEFLDPAYREQLIARERARGHTVTRQQLLAAAERMKAGAQRMREGAAKMRERARQMRDGEQ